MVNEEIVTVLRNAIEHGDSLQEAIQIMINSGYNPQEVNEASRFVGGIMPAYQVKPDEHLSMPSNQSNFQNNPLNPKLKQESQIIKQAIIQDSTPRTQTSQYTAPYKSQQDNPQSAMQNQQSNQGLSFNIPGTQPTKKEYTNQIQQRQIQPPQQMQISQNEEEPEEINPPSPQFVFPNPNSGLSGELRQIGPKKSHSKEIILLIILVILIVLLITTFLFKDKIIAWFA
ncbi:MAG: hypothetical protein WC438_00470 [Candidatus Pacearchaeota archaeon]